MRISTFQTILRKNEFLLRKYFFLKKSSTKISSTFLFFRWAGSFNFPHPPHSMVKIIKKFSDFYSSRYREKMNRKLTFFKTKMTIPRKIKIGKIRFFFLFRKFWIFHVNLTTFWKKNSKVVKSTWKFWSRLNRKKSQISDFSDFYFSRYGHFCDVITPIFDEISR